MNTRMKGQRLRHKPTGTEFTAVYFNPVSGMYAGQENGQVFSADECEPVTQEMCGSTQHIPASEPDMQEVTLTNEEKLWVRNRRQVELLKMQTAVEGVENPLTNKTVEALSRVCAECDVVELENKRLKTDNFELRNELSQLKQTVSRQKDEISIIADQRNRLQEKLNHTTSEVDSLKSELTTVQGDYLSNKSCVDRLIAEKDHLRIENQELNEKVKSLAQLCQDQAHFIAWMGK